MKLELISCRGPVWANEDHTRINCWVETRLWHGEMPYNAVPDDGDPFCRDLFRRCASGEFGDVGPHYPHEHPSQQPFSGSAQGLFLQRVPPPVGGIVNHLAEVAEFFAEANAENARGTVRGVTLVWGALLENTLQRFIETEMGRQGLLKNDLRRRNGGRYRGRWTTQDKIDIAVDYCSLPEEFEVDLHAIRTIRNCIAHEWSLSFENPEVDRIYSLFEDLHLKYVPGLKIDRDLEVLTRMVYAHVCLLWVYYLVDRS